uniref:Pre-rRNA-processing protein TSR2 homolog n=1 Tax=Rhabditophanes sp. KR3021 TaxID=114890 RepID=A0AC35UHX4_9BILA
MSDQIETLIEKHVSLVFKCWEVIDFIVSQSVGGSDTVEKVEWLKEICAEYAVKEKSYEVADFVDWIENVLNYDFDFVVDDGSTGIYAKEILDYAKAVKSKDESKISTLEARVNDIYKMKAQKGKPQHTIQEDSDVEESDGEESGEEPMDESEPKEPKKKGGNYEDEDGFTVIKRN